MGLFDDFLGGGFGGGIFKDGPMRLPRNKEANRSVERFFKKHIPPLGDVYEKINNAEDSIENLGNAIDPLSRLSHEFSDLSVSKAKRVFKKGDHIATMRTIYSHHGIYDGHGGVYEYQEGYVQHSSLESFANGDKLYRVEEGTIYSKSEIISRASSRIGEDEYNLLYNNCENFATWCRLGSQEF